MTLIQYRPKFDLYVRAISAISLIIFIVLISYEPVLERRVGYIGSLSMVVWAMWWLLVNKLWCYWPITALHYLPDLRGRWEGTIDRERENDPHTFVLEVRQTLLSIRCNTYTKNGNSDSLMCAFLCDDGRDPFMFAYTWFGSTSGSAAGLSARTGHFHGTTVLRVERENDKVISLKGEYFTDRYPRQTRGVIELSHASRELRHAFGESIYTRSIST